MILPQAAPLAQLWLSFRPAISKPNTTMSTRAQETEFLRRLMGREDPIGGQDLPKQLSDCERSLSCIRRAARRVALLMGLCVVGIGYGLVFLPGILERRPHFLLQFFYTVLTACLICLGMYAVAWLHQCHVSAHLRAECRRLLLGDPRPENNRLPKWERYGPMPGSRLGLRGVTPVADGEPALKAP